MKNIRMQDIPWKFSKEDMAKLYPHYTEEEQLKAAETMTEYVNLVARIYDRAEVDGSLEKSRLRQEYDKRDRNKHSSESHNVKDGH